MSEKYYLAYGSNLNKKQMAYRCPDAEPVATGELHGWQLLFRGSKTGSYLTIERKTGGTVPFAIWKISEDDEESLDRYEGYPTFYRKEMITVTGKSVNDGLKRRYNALVYIMDERRPIGVPSTYYMRTCLEGYEDFGLPHRPLLRAEVFAYEEITRLKKKPISAIAGTKGA